MTAPLVLKDIKLAGRERPRLRVPELRLESSRMIALVGPNGSGKTSLLRAVLGLERELSGTILCGEQNLLTATPRGRAEKVGWLPQHEPHGEGVSVFEFLRGACFRFDASREEIDARILEGLCGRELGHLAHAQLSQLSGGERQRLGLTALMLQGASWWLCDEPANHLDPKQQLLTYGTLGAAWRGGQALLCVTHDVNLLWQAVAREQWGDVRVVGMDRGEIVVDDSLLSPGLAEGLSEIYRLDVRRTSREETPLFTMNLAKESR